MVSVRWCSFISAKRALVTYWYPLVPSSEDWCEMRSLFLSIFISNSYSTFIYRPARIQPVHKHASFYLFSVVPNLSYFVFWSTFFLNVSLNHRDSRRLTSLTQMMEKGIPTFVSECKYSRTCLTITDLIIVFHNMSRSKLNTRFKTTYNVLSALFAWRVKTHSGMPGFLRKSISAYDLSSFHHS